MRELCHRYSIEGDVPENKRPLEECVMRVSAWNALDRMAIEHPDQGRYRSKETAEEYLPKASAWVVSTN